MVRYEYRCPACGPWTAAFPMGAAEAARPCPECGVRSPRLWSAPALNRMDPGVARLRQSEEASSDAPGVTSTVPAAARRPRRTDPRQARLPRP
ncbi:zinc ribbon domain-containing protein [Pseudonocardia aurantiaca]|uniref:Zinc ribbon domain-containing protein n=1 Tax=Pseudonocardia aurantiaca TaxID=75290 RepID=A0ABW4FJN5_9PSEU